MTYKKNGDRVIRQVVLFLRKVATPYLGII